MTVYPVDKFDWQRHILEMDGIPQLTKLVALAMSWYANRDGTNCHPGIERLAQHAGLGDRQLRRHLEVLRKDLGLLNRTAHGGGRGRRLADVYQLVVPDNLPERIAEYNKRRTSRCPENRLETQDIQASAVSTETQDIRVDTPDIDAETPDIGAPYVGHPDVHPPGTYTSHIDQRALSSRGDDNDEEFESARNSLAALAPLVSQKRLDDARQALGDDAPMRAVVIRAAHARTAIAS